MDETHTTDQPQNQNDDQDGAENTTESRPPIASVSVISAPSAKQQNNHHDQQNKTHDQPFE